MKLSEPCNRGALKSTNAAFVFLNDTRSKRAVPSSLSRAAHSNTAWQASETSSANVGVNVGSPGSSGCVLGRCTIPQNVWVVGPFAELGNSQVLRPQRSQPSTGHCVSRGVPSNPDEVQDDRTRQEYPIQTSRGVVLLLCERADVVADRLAAPVSDCGISRETSSFPRRQATLWVACKRNSGSTRVLSCSTDFSPPSHSEVMSGYRRRSLISGHRTLPGFHAQFHCSPWLPARGT